MQTSPTHPATRALLALLTGFLLLLAAAPAMAAWDLQQLMDTLAQSQPGRATFTEKKRIAVLDKPVESSGELLFTAPDRLEKKTLKPRPESLLVQGDELLIERGRQKHRLQLSAYPELGAFIDSIRGTLAGDRKALERSYSLTLGGSLERWTLQLVPLNEKMLKTVSRITMAGSGGEVRSIEIVQADGDSSTMTIEKLNAP